MPLGPTRSRAANPTNPSPVPTSSRVRPSSGPAPSRTRSRIGTSRSRVAVRWLSEPPSRRSSSHRDHRSLHADIDAFDHTARHRGPTCDPAAHSCSLSNLELTRQLGRYRAAGGGAEVVEWGKRRRVIRIATTVPESLIETLVVVERACCPFYELTWDRASRCLAIGVSASDQEPALDAIGYALGVSEATRE